MDVSGEFMKTNTWLNYKHDYLLHACTGKKVLHIGATDYPYHEERAKKGILLHQKLNKVANVTGLDISKDAIKTLKENGIEFRRGLSGGGNQLRQPWFKKHFNIDHSQFPNMEHVHHFGWYIGNYPGLEKEKILKQQSCINP